MTNTVKTILLLKLLMLIGFAGKNANYLLNARKISFFRAALLIFI